MKTPDADKLIWLFNALGVKYRVECVAGAPGYMIVLRDTTYLINGDGEICHVERRG